MTSRQRAILREFLTAIDMLSAERQHDPVGAEQLRQAVADELSAIGKPESLSERVEGDR